MSVYAFSDIHGRLDLLQQIQEFLKPDDKVYFLGDAGDRGPEPWKVIKEIAKDKRMIYIKGNHEDMLEKAMKDYLLKERFERNYQLLVYNGGEETFNQWLQEENKSGWYTYLKNLVTYQCYVNQQDIVLHLSHAGFNPSAENAWLTEEGLLWDREHYFIRNPTFHSNEIIVHGHTPIPILLHDLSWSQGISTKWESGAFWYANNHKVDIDCGSCTTGQTVLLNLDTFEEHIFKEETNHD